MVLRARPRAIDHLHIHARSVFLLGNTNSCGQRRRVSYPLRALIMWLLLIRPADRLVPGSCPTSQCSSVQRSCRTSGGRPSSSCSSRFGNRCMAGPQSSQGCTCEYSGVRCAPTDTYRAAGFLLAYLQRSRASPVRSAATCRLRS